MANMSNIAISSALEALQQNKNYAACDKKAIPGANRVSLFYVWDVPAAQDAPAG